MGGTKIRYLNLIVMLLLIPGVIGFTASSQYAERDVCVGSTVEDPISIFNDDAFPKEFSIVQEKDFPGVFAPDRFIVDPFDSQLIYHYISSNKEGSWRSSLLISTNDEIRRLVQTYNFVSCPNLDVGIDEYSYSNCPCVPTIYQFRLRNTGDFTDSFDISIDMDQDYYVLSQNPVILDPGETRSVFVYVTLPCDRMGDYEMHFITQAKVSEFKTSTPFYLRLKDGCYEFDVAFEEIIGPNTTSDGQSFSVCVQKNYTLPFKITNNGELNTTYSFFDTSTEVVPLGGTDTANIQIIPDTDNFGNSTIEFSITADAGEYEKFYSIDIEYRDCDGNLTKQSAQQTGKDIIYVILLILFILLMMILVILLIGILKKGDDDDDDIDDDSDDGSGKAFPWATILLVLFLIILLLAIGWFTWTYWPYGNAQGSNNESIEGDADNITGNQTDTIEVNDTMNESMDDSNLTDGSDGDTSETTDDEVVEVPDDGTIDQEVTITDPIVTVDDCIQDDSSDEMHCFTKIAFDAEDASLCQDIPENTADRIGNIAFCLGILATYTDDQGVCDVDDNLQQSMCNVYYDRWSKGNEVYDGAIERYTLPVQVINETVPANYTNASVDETDDDVEVSQIWDVYKWYILAFIAIILILIVVFSMKRSDDRKDNVYWAFILVITFVLLFLLVLLFFFTNLHQKFGYEVNTGNDSYSISLEENSTNYVWRKNTQKTIDMSKYIKDDTDNITLRPTPTDNITIEVEGMKLIFTPDPDWTGVRLISLIAEDEHGSRAYSPDIRLIVEDKGPWYEEVWKGTKEFFTNYLAYILAVILIIIVATVVLLKLTSD